MQKDFDGWNERKKLIQQTECVGFVHEREIWWCSVGLNIGDEADGKNMNFERPVLVLKKFNRRIVLTVPLTTKIKNNPYYFPFVHDRITFAVVISQLRLLSTNRFTRRIRKIDNTLFEEIKEKIIERAIQRTNPA